MSISKRAIRGVNQENILLDYFCKAAANLFHPEKNPEGVINMGTSENHNCTNMIHEKVASIQLQSFPKTDYHYCTMHGTPEFRKALALFLDRYMKPAKPIDKNDLYVMNGCGSVVEMLAFAICNDGDALLIPTPYYGAFRTDLMCRMGCLVYPIDLSSTPEPEYGETKSFELSVARIEKAYEKAKMEDISIKGIILANPQNPLGCVYTKSELISYLKFADHHRLHVILDEIYFLSIFDEDVKMTPGLSLDGVIDPNLLHIVWGFSKDFGVSGFRCGLVHTVNKDVANIVASNSYSQSTSTVAQYLLQGVISDFDWLDNVYFPTNRKRLRDAHAYVRKELNEIGVEVFEGVSGLFAWVDFRKFVRPLSREGELKLMDMFLDHGVYITAGVAFSSAENGWFRIIISVGENLKEGIRRIKTVLKKVSDGESNCEDNLDDLVHKLQRQIENSNWLDENSAEKWTKENPELAKRFQEEKERSDNRN